MKLSQMPDQSDVLAGCIEQIILKWKRLKVQKWSLPIQGDTSRSSRGVIRISLSHETKHDKGCKLPTKEQAFLEKGATDQLTNILQNMTFTFQWCHLQLIVHYNEAGLAFRGKSEDCKNTNNYVFHKR